MQEQDGKKLKTLACFTVRLRDLLRFDAVIADVVKELLP